MYSQNSGDFGDIAAQLDKIIHLDDEIPSFSFSEPLADRPQGFSGLPLASDFLNLPPTAFPHSSPIYLDRGAVISSPGMVYQSLAPVNSSSTGVAPEWMGGFIPKDVRQVRLFKTRICSYGDECPYFKKGRCLFAHTREEVRIRPPPPPPSPIQTSASFIKRKSPMKTTSDRPTARTICLNQILLNGSISQNVAPQIVPSDNLSYNIWPDYAKDVRASNISGDGGASSKLTTGLSKSLFEELFS